MQLARTIGSAITAMALACGGEGASAEGSGTDGTAATLDDDGNGTDASAEASDDEGTVDGDGAEILVASLPSTLACGDTFTAEIMVRNTGTSTWSRTGGYALGAVDDLDPLSAIGRIELPEMVEVEPGEAHGFAFELTAPADAGVVTTDWRMVHENVAWFGDTATSDVTIDCGTGMRSGPVRLDGRSFADDGGPFVALGATMMWGAWAYRNDRPKLEANLQFLGDNGFHYVRALGVVGDPNAEDYWDGREIEFHWPDYADVIRGFTELAWDEYGLRVEWTLIGDGQVAVPTPEERDALADVFVALADARPDAIIHFEIANEAWQNGFSGDEGTAELRARTIDLRGRTDVLVAASAAYSDSCDAMMEYYAGDVADLATVHVDRDLGQAEGPWRPVWIPSLLRSCDGLPVATNNEPIGPGASVATEEDPERLVAGALGTWLSGWPGHVFHSNAGVRGDTDLWEMAGITELAALESLVPADLASWPPRDLADPAGPLRVYTSVGAELVADATWPNVAGATGGVVQLLTSEDDGRFVALALGILGTAVLEARRPLSLEIIEPRTGTIVDSRDLATGERLELSGAGALLLVGE